MPLVHFLYKKKPNSVLTISFKGACAQWYRFVFKLVKNKSLTEKFKNMQNYSVANDQYLLSPTPLIGDISHVFSRFFVISNHI